MKGSPKVALVQDALPFLGGAERVLEAVWELFPQAPLYTLVYNQPAFESTPFAQKTIIPSWMNRLPGVRADHRRYLPIMPLVVEGLDLSEFDLILSFSYAVAHGVKRRPGQRHLSYIYTPLRYAWHYYERYVNENGYQSGFKGWLFKHLMGYMRSWGRLSASQVDGFMAVSACVEKRVRDAYSRPAEVIYPPVEVGRFSPAQNREAYYITIGRLVSYKRLDLVVEAFSRLGLPLYVVGEGPEYARLAKLAGPTVRLLGWQPDDVVADLLGKAKAFVSAAEEDFGIAMVEAQAAGCPLIAYAGGGAREILLEGSTGFTFEDQTVEGLMAAVERFERSASPFSTEAIRENAKRFSKERFQKQFCAYVEEALSG